jgi:hypothetical protein
MTIRVELNPEMDSLQQRHWHEASRWSCTRSGSFRRQSLPGAKGMHAPARKNSALF